MPGENPFRSSTEASAPAPAPPPSLKAWQPLTPEGAAAFAYASKVRLFTAELIIALLAVASIVWFVQVAWFPVMLDSIRQLPDSGSIEHGRLVTPHTTPDPLARNKFLALAVDVAGRSNPTAGQDIYLKFNPTNLQICSFLGCLTIPYPADYAFHFNRHELEPRWGAWMPFIVGSAAALGVIALLLTWSLLALTYAPIVRLLGFFRDKNVGFGACWKLASATLLPGAFFLTVGIMLYGLQIVGVIPFSILVLVHFFIPWIYLVLAPRTLPDLASSSPENPFATSDKESTE